MIFHLLFLTIIFINYALANAQDRNAYCLDLMIATSKSEYVDERDLFIPFLNNRKDILISTIRLMERHYPDSRYAFIDFETAPYTTGCGHTSPFYTVSEVENGSYEIEDLDEVPEKNKCELYSAILSNIFMAVTKDGLNWREKCTDSNKKLIRIILVVTNYWEDFVQGTESKCKGPLPATLTTNLVYSNTSLGVLATEDVLCTWKEIFYDMDYINEFLKPFVGGNIPRVLLDLVDTIVFSQKRANYEKWIQDINVSMQPPELNIISATMTLSVKLIFICIFFFFYLLT